MLTTRLRHRVTLKKLTVTQDSNTGEVVETWANTYENVPAEVLTGAGKEPVIDNAKQSQVDARITIRWLNETMADLYKMRLVWDSQTFEIVGVMTDKTGRFWIRLECKAVGNG